MKLTLDQALRKAATLALKGRKGDAEQIYRSVLQRFPDNPRAAAGLQALAVPRHAQAEREEAPQADIDRLVGLLGEDRLDETVQLAAALLARYRDAALLHSAAGVAQARLGQFEAALASFDRVVAFGPIDANAYVNRGNALRSLQRHDEAMASYGEALRLNPGLAEVHLSRADCLRELGRRDDALADFDASLRLDPAQGTIWYNRGNLLVELERGEDALKSYERAIELIPDFAEAHNNRGNLLRDLGRPLEDALASYDEVARRQPDLASAHNNRGLILTALNRFQEALVAFDTAVRLKPDWGAVYNNAGNALQQLDRHEEAILCYNAAISVEPDQIDAHGNLANALGKLNRMDEAVAAYEVALRLRPDLASAQALMLYHKAHMCDWSDPGQSVDMAALGIEGDAVGPFAMFALEDHPARQLARARRWTETRLPPAGPPLAAPGARPERLRIGYFSADYYDHATMLLMAKLFETHDRDRFEWHAFSYGPDKRDKMQKRAEAAFDQFHEIRGLNDAAAAKLARDLGIDVAVDLKGYTRDNRSGIFAHRAAPVQMSYIGFPGSMGADFFDYIVADRVVIPAEMRQFYDEKVIWMPHSYQVNDDDRPVAQRHFTRAELNLPDGAFVFCCFNNNYKISPAEFDVWMRLLGKVDGSVLWLLEGNEWARTNLAREAEARGIDPARLVFAPRMLSADHVARHRSADLFLDTFNYNAHTTGSDALWAGLPIVTRAGQSFAARVGASLLEATGLGELVTHSTAEYEELALALAADRPRLAAIRAKLAAQLPGAPLFDTARFARGLEQAYDLAFARRMAGLPPDHIDVAAELARTPAETAV